jgi:rhamnosyltransferase subunit B
VRVFLTAIGSAGDVFPFLGLGRALLARGHTVTLLTNAHFEAEARQAGLELLALGTTDEYRAAVSDPLIWHPRRGFERVMRWVRPQWQRTYSLLEQHAAAAPDAVIVAHYLDFGARVLRDAYPARLATIVLSPLLFRSRVRNGVWLPGADLNRWPGWATRAFFRLADALIVDPMVLPWLNALRHSVGLGPIQRPMQHWVFSPDRVLGLFPDWFGAPQPDWPPATRLVGFPLFDAATAVPAEVEGFLAHGPPPVVFTPGSAMGDPSRFLTAAAEACRRLGRRGLLLARWGGRQVPVEANLQFAPFAPLSRILDRCAALVHHGGVGTTAAGLAAGVPQLALPLSHDQPDNAARLVRLGVGDWLPARSTAGPEMADRLARLLASASVQARCHELAARVAGQDGLAAACAEIEALANARQ